MSAVLLDAFLLQFAVPKNLPDAAVGAARRVLDRRSFRTRLLRAAEEVVRRHPELARIALTLTR